MSAQRVTELPAWPTSTFDRIGDFGLLDGLGRVARYRRAVSRRPSVVSAAPAGYPERLAAFLRRRDGHLARLLAAVA